MDRSIPSIETESGAFLMRISAAFLFIALLLAAYNPAHAESLASKNKKGNQLYEQGKYPDAEKQYLDAQVNNPGNPSVLYNLGNSLIRQKKYAEGAKALDQAIEKGDKTARENSWYNKGNALFSSGQFKESAGAFIEALKLDPADKDAKNNLELALQKMQQQEQKSKQPDSQKQDPKNSDQKQQNQKQDNAGQNRKEQNEQNERKEQQKQPMQQPRREGAVDKEKALQILDAVQKQELDEKRKLLEQRARKQANGKDW
jgi:Ca-activated chloride channel homolog